MFVPALTLILALTSSAVIAVPIVNNIYKRAVASLDPSSAEFTFYFPESFYESIPHSGAPPSSSSETDDAKTATDYIFKKLDLGENDFKVVDSYTDYFGISHVYGTHMINDVGVSNHQAAAHAKNGEVAFFSTSFGTEQHLAKKDLIISEPKATLDFKQASATASAQLGIPVYSEVEHTFEYVELPDGKVVYAYKFQLRDNPVTKWVEVWCSTTTGEAIQAADFGKEASYQVIARPHRDPTDGFSGLAKVSTEKFTPRRWTDGKVTEGNNAITRDPSGKPTRSIGNDVFYTQFNSREEPGSAANIAAAAVNLFYLTNIMHDISAQYGFTERAGNFQTDNFDLGGKGNDAVIINVLDPSKTNGAEFFTPPDGQPGVMNMYRFTKTTPNRNPGLDNAIVIHEYAHGISDRLTGGPSTASCLNTVEARGMSEGWSDFMAMFFLAKESDTDMTEIPIGAYSENNPKGVRMRLYTTAITINPLTYRSLKTRKGFHDIGEVWTIMLWEVYWNLVTKYGFAKNLYKAEQFEGNIVAMRIIIGGMMTQPCNPTFLAARDAIIATDNLHYQGDHKCEIYRGFAKRGLGLGATDTHKNDFTVPPECRW
ncbi:hypothetical protein BASA50_000989 [Batrachochytrium salamandrivorans]|uniref:Extracellular metalloproteinase n=1 Tax=Batrachochytrium salamandrivorans TaxID=1357716 RepID=A0ABQ8ESD8_9FUNG|nr:hypothetical protein BASA60_010817 [Batrachochytrium salamandrivorans]KAH6585828.1 hypothetical protein BASA50_000989 [Batrachochytrium salamandrivorans]KAH9253066.1 hypothetical protein BASA81_008972 [Batrachochytrium salamandrivorans]KAH9269457.1 hypothetical protein BASA83_008540 [Batrachochytrium salamandrivorans]